MAEKKETQIKRFEGKAAFFKQKADREWAYAKNDLGDEHYGRAKTAYNKAKEFQDKADKLKGK